MENNSYNPIVKKKELIDILFQKNKEGSKIHLYNVEPTKEDINNIIDSNQRPKMDFSLNFDNLLYFKINDDKYVYVDCNKEIEDIVKQIDYILDNRLIEKNNNDLKHLKSEYLKQLEYNKNNKKTLEEKFKDKSYDYIKIIFENFSYDEIGIKDIYKSIEFLNYHENVHKYLTIEEQIILRLIILFGIKNVYLNNNEYYKDKFCEIIDYVMKNINDYISFIKENMDNIKDEYQYSYKNEYRINLIKDLPAFWTNKQWWEIPCFKHIDKKGNIPFIYLLRYINFDYYVVNKKFEEAKKIFEMNLPMFSFFKDSKYTVRHMIGQLIIDTDNISNGLLYSEENIVSYNNFNTINFNLETKRNIKVMLKFYISCYLYFKHFKDIENANKVYEYLLYFKNGYNIDNFIEKCRYIKMTEDICELKIDDIDDEQIDKAINKMQNKIAKLKIINKFDVDDVILSYPYINFDNLDKRVKIYIATGDKIMNNIDNDMNTDFDYSSAVIEWSKAVELEINNKLISQLANYKANIEEYSRQINHDKDEDFKLNIKNATIGFYKAIKKYNLQSYLYNQFFSKSYTFDENTYNKLCQYIRDIWKPRNDSAHKDKSIDIITATNCKEKILASTKILEILSKLEKRC